MGIIGRKAVGFRVVHNWRLCFWLLILGKAMLRQIDNLFWIGLRHGGVLFVIMKIDYVFVCFVLFLVLVLF